MLCKSYFVKIQAILLSSICLAINTLNPGSAFKVKAQPAQTTIINARNNNVEISEDMIPDAPSRPESELLSLNDINDNDDEDDNTNNASLKPTIKEDVIISDDMIPKAPERQKIEIVKMNEVDEEEEEEENKKEALSENKLATKPIITPTKPTPTPRSEEIAKAQQMPTPAKNNETNEETERMTQAKANMLASWKSKFSGIVSEGVLEKKLPYSSMLEILENIEDIDAIEVISKLNNLNFDKFFLSHHELFELIEGNIDKFFLSCHNFIKIFNHMKPTYYGDRKLALYIKVTMSAMMKDQSEMSNIWNAIFEISNNNCEISDLELLATNYFQALRPEKKGRSWKISKDFVDFVFSQRAIKTHRVNLKEYNRILSILKQMCEESWLKNNKQFTKNFFANTEISQIDDTSAQSIVEGKLLQAKDEIEEKIEKIENTVDHLERKAESLQNQICEDNQCEEPVKRIKRSSGGSKLSYYRHCKHKSKKRSRRKNFA